MTKEEKQNLKLIEKQLTTVMRKFLKEYNVKTVGGFIIFKTVDNFFFTMLYVPRCYNGRYVIQTFIYVKPYSLDNIFWIVFDMESNLKEPDSLRANGAFASPSFKFIVKDFEIDIDADFHEISVLILSFFNDNISMFLNTVHTINDFLNYISQYSGYADEKLIKMLVNIEIGNFQTALDMVNIELDKGERGNFGQGDKYINEYVKEYCMKNI